VNSVDLIIIIMKRVLRHIFWDFLIIVIVLAVTVVIHDTHADSLVTDFEDFALGDVNGQSGWAGGNRTSHFDIQVVPNTFGYPTFGSRSLRISNAVTSNGFGNQTFSSSLINDAGETEAATSTDAGGITQPYFSAQWDFASARPTSYQPGLVVVASPDPGNGSRMSWLRMADMPSGLELAFSDFESSTTDGFIQTIIASGIDRTVPHTAKITMQFIDGPGNDIVQVYLDGVLIYTGTSWEDYSRAVGSPPSPVDSIMFRVAGTAVPANSGYGFLIDNFSESSGPVPVPVLPPATLHVIKVVADGSGTATPSAFNVYVKSAGANVFDSPALGTSAPGTLYSLPAGLYTISEDASSLFTSSYSGNCDANGSTTLFSGGDEICTITSSLIPEVLAPVPIAPPASASSLGSLGSRSGGGRRPQASRIVPGFPNTGSVTSAIFRNLLSEGNILNVPADVRRLQTLLATDKLIYPQGLVTGYFGSLTFQAVKKFQEVHGVAVQNMAGVGVVGPLTRAALEKVFGRF